VGQITETRWLKEKRLCRADACPTGESERSDFAPMDSEVTASCVGIQEVLIKVKHEMAVKGN
jgi:hypothetical protein